MRSIWLNLILIICLSFFACRTRKAAQTEKTIAGRSAEITTLLDSLDLLSDLDPGISGSTNFKQETYKPSVTQEFKLIHTYLELIPIWDSTQLKGVARLTLRPWFYPSDSLILDAKGFFIRSVKMLAPEKRELSFFYPDSAHLRIVLGKSFARTDTLIVEVDYTANPSSIQSVGSAAIHSDRGLYFVNPDGKDSARPRQLWTQGEPESSSCWFPTLDAPNQKTTQEVYITVPDSFISLSNGKLISTKKNLDGTRTDYWKQDKPHAPYLFMIAAGKYSKVTDSWKGIPVEYFVEPKFEKYARMSFGNTPEMIEFFSNKFNYPFPWDKYAQIVVREFVSGAMENTGAVVHFEFLQQDSFDYNDGNYEDIISHELAHHWFGDLVTAESWSQISLNESFASYGEYLWREYKYGKEEAARHIRNDLNVYLYQSGSKRKPLVRHHFHAPGDVFDVNSYQKGSCILHYLRQVVGDEAFFESLSLYLKKQAFNSAEVHHLRLAIEEVTGKDFKTFFDQWFYSSGHPNLEMEVEWDEISSETSITIRQSIEGGKQEVWEIPTELMIYEGNQEKYYPIVIQSRDTVIRIKSDKNPKAIVLDPKRVLPGRIREKRSLEDWKFIFENCSGETLISQALDELAMGLGEDSLFQFVSTVAADESLHYGLRVQAIEALSYYDGPMGLDLALKGLSWCRHSDIRIRMAAYEMLGIQYDQLNDEGQVDDALKASVRQVWESGLKDSSYTIQSLSLEGMYGTDEKAALEFARKINGNSNVTLILTALKLLGVSEDSLYFPLIIDALKAGLSSMTRFAILNLLEGEVRTELSETRQNEMMTTLSSVLSYDPMPEMRRQAAVILFDWGELNPKYQEDIKGLLQTQLVREKNAQVSSRIQLLLESDGSFLGR